jgi:amino acid transporter
VTVQRPSVGKLRLLSLIATIFFCVSGGPFGLEEVMQSGAGMGLLLILVTPILWSIPAAMMTAELASAIPSEGGYYVWVRRALGPFAGFLCGWWTWVYSWVDVAIYPTLFAAYIHALIGQLGGHSGIEDRPWLKWLIGLVVVVPFTAMNVRGVRTVGETAVKFVVLLLVPFVVMAIWGATHVVTHPPQGIVAAGQSVSGAFGAGLFVVMWNYLGWDSMSTVAAEVENPQRNFPRAIAIGVPLVIFSYLLPAIVGLSFLPQLDQWKEGAWTAVAERIGGPGLAIAMTLAGVIGACGLFSSTLLASSRIPLVLAEDGFLPTGLARIHPRFGTPYVAILVSALVYTALSFETFSSLASLDVVMYSAGLMLEFAALIALRLREPDLARPYKIPGGWMVLSWICVAPAAVVGFAVVSQYGDPKEGGASFLWLSGVGLASGPVIYWVSRAFGSARRRS